jgi:hypothetical protein
MRAPRLHKIVSSSVGALSLLGICAVGCGTPGRAALERAEVLLRSDPALALLRRFETHARLRKADDLYDLVALFSVACRRGCTGFRAHAVDTGGGYQLVRWVPRIAPGTLLLDRRLGHGLGDLLRALASFGRVETLRLEPQRMRRFPKRALVRARLVVQGIDRSGARRVDSGLIDLDLRVRAARWRIDGFRVARVHTVRRAGPAYRLGASPQPSRASIAGRSAPRALLETPAGFVVLEGRGRELWARPLGPRGASAGRVLAAVPRGPLRAVSVADLDGDGISEIILGSAGGDSAILARRGDAYVRLPGWGVEGAVSALVVADFDRDGALDLLVGRAGRTDLLWRGRAGRGAARARPTELAGSLDTAALCAADLDGDGRLDLLRVSRRGPSQLLLGRRGRFVRSSQRLGGPATSCALGDVDGDGRLDLFIGERGARSAFLLARRAVSVFGWGRRVAAPGGSLWLNRSRPKAPRFARAAALRDAVGWSGWAAFCDHDADGDLDLWRRRFEAAPAVERRWWFGKRSTPPPLSWRAQELWLGDGRGALASAAFAARLPRRGAGGGVAADLNGDGRLELLGGQAVARWRGSHEELGEVGAGAAALLRLRMPRGANRDAIGAVLRVRAGGRWQTRVVGLASGWPGAAPGWLHIGLGAALRIERLELRWPDGRREVHEDLPARRLLQLSPQKPPRWTALPKLTTAAASLGLASRPASRPVGGSRPASRPASRSTSRPVRGLAAAIAALGQLKVRPAKGPEQSLAALLAGRDVRLLFHLAAPRAADCKRAGKRPLTVGPSARGCRNGRHLRVDAAALAPLRALLPAIVRWRAGVRQIRAL